MFKIKNIRPFPRQRIYKIFYLDFLLDFLTLNFKHGLKVKELEKEIIKLTNSKYGLALNRGRLGAFLAVKSIITPKKHKIILSPFTIFDVINMVICAGGTPVFADVERKTITMDYNNIVDAYDDEVAAVLITHTHTINKDIEKIINFTKNNNIYLIEDCAISFGTKFNNSNIGTLGDIGFFSFGMFKFVSSLNGGFILTKNIKIIKKIILLHNNFKEPRIFDLFKNYFKSIVINIFTLKIIFKYLTSYIIKFGFLNNIKFINNYTKNDPDVKLLKKIPEGYKVKISDSQARSIIKQLNNVEENLMIRINNAKIYYENLSKIEDLIIPPFKDDHSNGYLNFPIQYKYRDDLLRFLFNNNRDIAKYYYRNCDKLKIFDKYSKNLIEVEKVVNEIIILPTYPKYNKKQIYKNIELIKYYFDKKRKK